jgi:hypothetical protein
VKEDEGEGIDLTWSSEAARSGKDLEKFEKKMKRENGAF